MHTGCRLVQLIHHVLLVVGVGGPEALGREQARHVLLLHAIVVQQCRDRVGAAGEARCSSLHRRQYPFNPFNPLQGPAHEGIYIHSTHSPATPRHQAAGSDNVLSSCQNLVSVWVCWIRKAATMAIVAVAVAGWSSSSLPQVHLFSYMALGCTTGQSRRDASQTSLVSQTCTRLHPVSPAQVLATA
jgi:hypothetical protein